MEYTVLTAEHKQQMWRQIVGQLEERHFALMMDRITAAAVTGNSEEVAAHLAKLDAQIAAIAEQHAAARAELAGIAPAERAP